MNGSTYKPIINKAQPKRHRSVPKKLTPIVRTPSTFYATRHTVKCNLYTCVRDACLPTPTPPPQGGSHDPLPPPGGESQPRGRPQCYPSPRRGRLDAYPPRENARGNPLTISRGSKVPRVKTSPKGRRGAKTPSRPSRGAVGSSQHLWIEGTPRGSVRLRKRLPARCASVRRSCLRSRWGSRTLTPVGESQRPVLHDRR